MAYKETSDGGLLLRMEMAVNIPGQPLYSGQAVVKVPAVIFGWEDLSEPDENITWLDDDDEDFDSREEDYWRRALL